MYEERFRAGLKRLLKDRGLKHAVVAEKSGIKKDVFSKILNTNRKIFAEEVGGICKTVGLTFEEVLNYPEPADREA